jgi:hypothetical protein
LGFESWVSFVLLTLRSALKNVGRVLLQWRAGWLGKDVVCDLGAAEVQHLAYLPNSVKGLGETEWFWDDDDGLDGICVCFTLVCGFEIG